MPLQVLRNIQLSFFDLGISSETTRYSNPNKIKVPRQKDKGKKKIIQGPKI